jgi:exodeoxyribonuclease V gamma subunit
MIHYFEAQNPTELIGYLSQQLQKNTSPLEAPWVVVPNREFQEWVEREVALQKGSSAHLNYVFPVELIWKLYRSTDPEVPKKLPTDLNALSFRIFELLEKDPLFMEVYEGLEDEMQRFALAQQYADVYDQYLNVRPQMILGWEKGIHDSKYPHDGITDSHLELQMRLWKSITDSLIAESRNHISRSSIYIRWFELLQSAEIESLKNQLPNQLFVLGERDWGEVLLKSLEGLSAVCDVHLVNYSSFTSFSLSRGNTYSPFLKNLSLKWQQSCRSSEGLLRLSENLQSSQTPQVSEDPVFTLERILDLEGTIHSCHSPKREVEVLKDDILSFIKQNPDIALDTIGISVPDLLTYAPIITHVFGQEPRLPVYLPLNQAQSLRSSLIMILELVSGDFKMNQLVDVLNDPNIARVNDISDEDLKQIKHWITETNIHFGLEENHPFSFKEGLLSWWRGFLFNEKEFQDIISPSPSHLIRKNDHLEVLSKLQLLFDRLRLLSIGLHTNRSTIEWIDWIQKIFIENFETIRNEEGWVFDREIQWLDHLKLELSYTDVSISQDLFLKWFRQVAVEKDNHASTYGFGILVSEHIPNRLIPFNYVAMLGLNEQVFPGNQTRPIFDLIHRHPISGERERKKDLHRLFIERLALTNQRYFLSYEGSDVHTNKVKNPSPLITQLRYLHQEFYRNHTVSSDSPSAAISPKLMVFDHRLHGFSQDYFHSDTDKISFHKHYYQQLTTKLLDQNRNQSFVTDQFYEGISNESKRFDSIDLVDLIRFYQHPAKFLLERQLSIKPAYESRELMDFEQYELNHLDRYLVKNSIWDSIEQDYSKSECQMYLESKKIIPPLGVYQSKFDELYAEIHSFYDLVIPSQRQVGMVQTEITLDDSKLFGNLQLGQDQSIQDFRLGSMSTKYAIEYWIKFLFNAVSNKANKANYYYLTSNSPRVCTLSIEQSDQAVEILKRIVKGYKQGVESVESLHFLPNSSFAFITGGYDKRKKVFDESKAWAKAKAEWFPKTYESPLPSESEDIWNSMIWGEHAPVEDDLFVTKSYEFWDEWNEISNDKPFKGLS